jgi:hypothetical protein
MRIRQLTSNAVAQGIDAASIAGGAASAASAASAGAAAAAAPAAAANANVQAASNVQASATVNVQTFTGTLGGAAPAVISSASERPFAVNGATFLNEKAAIQRSCAVQNNACSNAANSGQVDGGVAACNAQEDACNAAANLKLLRSRKITKVRARAALDLGSCSDASIIFADNLDGRKEASFAPADSADFNHGSALNINVISSFICGQLASKCKAGQDAIDACAAGQAAANGLKAQAAADAFNAAIGA